MMEAIRSSETSVLSRVTWRDIPEDVILQNSLCLNVSKSAIILMKHYHDFPALYWNKPLY
jgi:hypothetical protein